jgi:glycosyltransferase involved in cell wall biosynthesis
MRVAQVCYGLNIGGVQRLAVNITNALADAGHEVVFFYRVDGPLREAVDPRVHLVQYARGLPRYSDPRAWLSAFCLASLLRKWHVDILHTYEVVEWALGAIAGRLAGVPVVRTQPNFIRKYERVNCRTLRLLPFERWTCAFHAIFSSTAYDLISAGVAQSKVFVETGVLTIHRPGTRTTIRERNAVGASHRVIATVGRIVAGKGWEMLPDIAEWVVREFPAARFWLVGDGPLRESLEARVRSMGLDSHIRFFGERTDIDAIYEASDICLFPAETHAGMVEAVAFAPLVAGRGPSQQEYVIDRVTGLLCDCTVQAFAKALLVLLKDEPLRIFYQQESQSLFDQRFSVASGVKRFVGMYHSVMANSKS